MSESDALSALCDILYKHLRNTLTYLLTVQNVQSANNSLLTMDYGSIVL